jgi:hypothetical protein
LGFVKEYRGKKDLGFWIADCGFEESEKQKRDLRFGIEALRDWEFRN